jgi:hypothetical protein
VTLQRQVHRPHDLDLARLFGQGPQGLRHSWVLATTLGETAGFLTPALVGVLAFDLHPALALLAMVGAGLVEGAVLGAAQAVVLRRQFLGFSRAAWTGATAAGAGAAWFLGMLPSTFYDTWRTWPTWLVVLLGAVTGLALLSCIGLAQWTVLRHHVARSRTWVPANAVAWTVGLTLLFLVATPLWQEGQSTALVIGIAVLAGLVMAVTVAVLTGAWLVRLVHPRSRSGRRDEPPGVPPEDWRELGGSTDGFALFDPALTEDLPEPVRRWLLHAVEPGTPLLTGVELEWTGHIRLGRTWRPFLARQRSTLEGGYVWAARTRMGGLPVTGHDRFTRGEGEMAWRLARRIPVMSGADDEVTRSASGRHVAELLSCLPAVALDPAVRWEPVDHLRATALLDVDGRSQAVTVTVDPVGRLREVEMDRWGTPPGESYGRHRFGAVLGGERRFDGYLVPTEVLGGWHFGTGRWPEGAFLEGRVTRCSFH